MRNLLLPLYLIVCFCGKTFAQEKLSKRDANEIRALARKKIEKNLPELINTLNLDDVGDAERKTVILNSYLPSTEQLFVGDGVIIEDDLNPARPSDEKPIDLVISKYFNNLDLFYKKSAEPTFSVSNVVVSEVKENANNQLYVKVFYRSHFKGGHTKITTPFSPQERVAEFKAEKVDKKWEVLITRIAYYIPDKEDGKTSVIEQQTAKVTITDSVKTASKDTTAKVIANKDTTTTVKPKLQETPISTTPSVTTPTAPLLLEKPSISTEQPAALQKLTEELSSYKTKKTILMLLGIGAIGTAGVMFMIANGKYSTYTSKINQNNATYTTWYNNNVGSGPPPADELAKAIPFTEYASPTVLAAGASVAVGLGFILWSGKYGKQARETKEKIANFKKQTSFVPIIDMPTRFAGFSISYHF